eukprot:1681498-Amphidinium_carterae.2
MPSSSLDNLYNEILRRWYEKSRSNFQKSYFAEGDLCAQSVTCPQDTPTTTEQSSSQDCHKPCYKSRTHHANALQQVLLVLQTSSPVPFVFLP